MTDAVIRPADPIELEAKGLSVLYGDTAAVRSISIGIPDRHVVAFIGPSGCGKSTLLRCFNRMNDLIPGARVEGEVLFQASDLYAPGVDPVNVRRRIGMVFQKPNPFPKSIRENILFGPKVTGMTFDADELVEKALRDAALWDEVKDKLDTSALALSRSFTSSHSAARRSDCSTISSIEPRYPLMRGPKATLS